eukprot:1191372-Prorocentrum_minimum.AAC.1
MGGEKGARGGARRGREGGREGARGGQEVRRGETGGLASITHLVGLDAGGAARHEVRESVREEHEGGGGGRRQPQPVHLPDADTAEEDVYHQHQLRPGVVPRGCHLEGVRAGEP